MKLSYLSEAFINSQANDVAIEIAQILCAATRSNKCQKWISQQAYYKIAPELKRLTVKHQCVHPNQTLAEFIITELGLFRQWLTIHNHFAVAELVKSSWDEAYQEAIESEELDNMCST